MSTTTLGVKLDAGTRERLKQAAASIDRTPHWVVKQAIFYIQRHFDQPLNRSDVAEAISVSENYLSQIFRQEMGISLWDYLNRQRINHAQHLLESTTTSVTEVAAAVGIYDPAYFSRIFHKQTGLSPSAYRVAAQRLPSAK